MSRWYRAYEGTVTDAKLAEVSLVVGCSRSVVIAAWHAVLENAASVNDGGRFDIPSRRIAAVLCEPFDTIEGVMLGFETVGVIHDSAIVSWKKRQFESDSSTERSQRHRASKRNANATLQQQEATPPETETETELEPNGSCPSDDEPAEVIKLHGKRKVDTAARAEFVEAWNDLSASLCLPQIRTLTSERTKALDARLVEHPVQDFLEVLANIRGSPFLRGETGWHGCTFDWVLKKGNFQKILEGNYNGQPVQIRRA